MLSPSALMSRSENGPAQPPPDGVTVLGVQFASIRHLFAPLSDRTDLMLVHVNDWLNDLRYRFRPNAFVPVEPLAGVDWREWRFPPGWASRFAPWVMPRLTERLRQAWRERGWANPRLVVTFPYFLPLAQAVGPERVVYYAVDNYQAYWRHRAAAVCAQENALIEAAGATVAASVHLAAWFCERVPSAAAKVHYLPNGVRADMIASPARDEDDPAARPSAIPQAFWASKGPVVGYYGNIGPASGLDLLAALAARLPDFRFLLMGQVLSQEAVDQLAERPNVFMTGRLQEPASRHVLQQCNVMLIPMPVDAYGQFVSPNRLWTYMATGRPIVSTPIPEIMQFEDIVYVAANLDELEAKVRHAAQENDPSLTARRLAVARMHTWPSLAQQMWTILAGDV